MININDSHINPELTFKRLVYLHMQQLTNFPYIEKDFDALTDYELLCLVVKFLNDVIKNSNEQNDSITNLYNAFLALQDYMNNSVQELEDAWNDKTNELETAFNNLQTWIDNYFDNLDVQEEIDNKLDQMLEDGILEQIIEQFIQSTALWCFNTVSDMKSATNLINGSYARTLGYFNAGDGGNGYYLISDEITSSEYETLNNNKIANLIKINPIETITNYIKYCEEKTYNNETYIDWLPAFNKIKELGIKSIYIPKGTYKISDTITFDYSIKIYGDGINNSTIMLMNDENIEGNSIIELLNNDGSCIRDICLNGNNSSIGKELDAGLYVHFSDNVCLDNVLIKHINGNGIKLLFESASNSSYDGKITKVQAMDCSKNGFYIGSTDTLFSNCIAHHVKEHGFYFTRGNNLLTNCKAYWTGESGVETTGDGFYLETDNQNSKIVHKNRLVNCESQECGRYGFTLINTDSCQLINCQADTCGMYCTTIVPYGYYINNNRNLIIKGTTINQGLTGWIKVPLYFNDGLLNDIDIKAQTLSYSGSNKYYDKLYDIYNFNGSNKIKINNNDCLQASYKNSLYSYNQATIPTDFTSEPHVNFVNNFYECNHLLQSTGIGIEFTTNNGTSINNKIYKDFTLDFSVFNKIGFNYTGKVNNSNISGNGRLRFYDSNNTELKQLLIPIIEYSDAPNKSLYWNFRKGNTEIPENTARIRLEFFVNKRIQDVSGIGYGYFKDVSIYFYNET